MTEMPVRRHFRRLLGAEGLGEDLTKNRGVDREIQAERPVEKRETTFGLSLQSPNGSIDG